MPVNPLQDTVFRRARMAVVNAFHAADELAGRLSRTERRIYREAGLVAADSERGRRVCS